jgi:hypothetical protein
MMNRALVFSFRDAATTAIYSIAVRQTLPLSRHIGKVKCTLVPALR